MQTRNSYLIRVHHQYNTGTSSTATHSVRTACTRWNVAAALHNPKAIILGSNKPYLKISAVFFWSSGWISICQNTEVQSRVEKYWLPRRVPRYCSILCNGKQSFKVRLLRDLRSIVQRTLPSFLCTRHTGDANSEHESTTTPTRFILLKFSSSFSKWKGVRHMWCFTGVSSMVTILW